MYRHICVPLENSAADEAILQHIRGLARLTQARLTLMHVADGFMARNQTRLGLDESDEMREDRAYLERRRRELAEEGFEVDCVLACGEPSIQISSLVDEMGCDLIAMSTHGHRFLSDLILGSVASAVRHRSMTPVLLVRAPTKP